MEGEIHCRKRGSALQGIHRAVSPRERPACLSPRGEEKGREWRRGQEGDLHGGVISAILLHEVAAVLVKAGQEQ